MICDLLLVICAVTGDRRKMNSNHLEKKPGVIKCYNTRLLDRRSQYLSINRVMIEFFMKRGRIATKLVQ